MPCAFKGCERLAIYISENEAMRKPQDTDDELFEWLKSSACCRAVKERAQSEIRSEILSSQTGFTGMINKRFRAKPDFQSMLEPKYQTLLLNYRQKAEKHYQASPRARAQTPPCFPVLARCADCARAPPCGRSSPLRGKQKTTLRIRNRTLKIQTL